MKNIYILIIALILMPGSVLGQDEGDMITEDINFSASEGEQDPCGNTKMVGLEIGEGIACIGCGSSGMSVAIQMLIYGQEMGGNDQNAFRHKRTPVEK